MRVAIHALVLHVPAPDAERIAAALAAAAGTGEPSWNPAVLIDGTDGRSCDIAVGGGAVVVVEHEPAALPTCVALTVPDVEVAVERLSAAGFSVTRTQAGVVRAFFEPVPGFAIQLLAETA